MSKLPAGWSSFSLSDLGGLSGGKTPSKAVPAFWSSPDVPWVSPKDMKKNLLKDSEDRISQIAVENAGMTLYPAGSILMVTRSGILQHTFPVALAGNSLTVNQDIKVLRPVEGLDPRFSFYLLKRFGSEILSACAKDGTTVQSLESEKLEAFSFPLPPSSEQNRIVTKLDKLLAQVDTLKTRIDGIPALLKRFRQSVLAAAVSGQLTEDWRNSEDTWLDTIVGNISSVSTGKTPKRDNKNYWVDGHVPWLTSAATGEDFCSIAEQFVTEVAAKECSLKVFPPGTLLMAMYGEGKTRGQVTELKIAASCNQACAAINVDEDLACKDFVKIRLKENYEEIRKQAVGGAQPNLNLNKVREIPIRLPSLDEQTEIVKRVERLFAFADQLNARVKAAQARIDGLTQSILAKAFRGELVAQDPNDEPASVLLQRIKAQRPELSKMARGRRVAVS